MTFKRIYILAMISILIAACSPGSDEVDNSSRKVTFRATAEKKYTRDANGATKQLPQQYKMLVSAVNHRFDNTHDYLFKDKLFAFNNDVWEAFNCNYPEDGQTIDFLAYAVLYSKNKPTTTYTALSESNINSFKTVTLDFGEKLDGNDPVVFSNFAHDVPCKTEDAVGLNFDYATSCLYITLDGEDDEVRKLLKLKSFELAEVPLTGELKITINDEKKSEAKWSPYKNIETDYTIASYDSTPTYPVEEIFYPLPTENPTDITVHYTFVNDKDRSFSFPLPTGWQKGERYTYAFTCRAQKIEIETGAWEGDWDTEIGGSAYEPDWNVEISTGAYEATWGVEIGGQGYELTWSVEIGVAALESEWLTEILSNASEEQWNSELSATAEENEWNSEAGAQTEEEGWDKEAGGTAMEEEWTEETTSNAFEEFWEVGDTIIIGREENSND